jgi:hypothetical protein
MQIQGYFNSYNKTNKCTYIRCVYHLLFAQHNVSIAVTITTYVNYKYIRNPN